MRSYLRVISLRQAAGFAAPLAFLVGFAALSAQEAWANGDFDPYYVNDEKADQENAYKMAIRYNNEYTCQYKDEDQATGGANQRTNGARTGNRNCRDTGTGNDMVAMQESKFRHALFNQDPNAPMQYFVKQQPGAVMACAVRFDGSTEKTLKQEATYQPGEGLMGKGAPFVATPVALFNQLQPEAPASQQPLILAQHYNIICSTNPNIAICQKNQMLGMQNTQASEQALLAAAMEFRIGAMGGGMASLDPELQLNPNAFPNGYMQANYSDVGLMLVAAGAGANIKKDKNQNPQEINSGRVKARGEPNSTSGCGGAEPWKGGGCSQ